MADCLTCEEIELKICELADSISAASCGGMLVKEGDTTFDYSPEVKAKIEVLRVYKQMFEMKCKGAGELYEFVQVPCVRPYTCVGDSCATAVRPKTHRRYRR